MRRPWPWVRRFSGSATIDAGATVTRRASLADTLPLSLGARIEATPAIFSGSPFLH
jgi:hypothetical protein